jgi:hypothetical protein
MNTIMRADKFDIEWKMPKTSVYNIRRATLIITPKILLGLNFTNPLSEPYRSLLIGLFQEFLVLCDGEFL